MSKRLWLFALSLFVVLGICGRSAPAQIALPGPNIITTIAGNGTLGYSGDGGAATSAELSMPYSVALDSSGNIYIADWGGSVIRKVNASTGIISTIAGTGTQGYSGDDGPATSAQISAPYGIAVDTSGNVYFSDENNNRIRKVTASSGVISTIAGTGVQGYSGDGGPATSSMLSLPMGLALDSAGNIYFADHGNNRIRKIAVSGGYISTVAGGGGLGNSPDGTLATNAYLNATSHVFIDASDNIFFDEDNSDDDNNYKVREVPASSGYLTTVAGTGVLGYSGDGGPATSAKLDNPTGIFVDANNNVYIATMTDGRVRKITASSGDISTIAGNGTGGYSGDGGAATSAELYIPYGVTLDTKGNIYIADTLNHRIRVVGAPGFPTTTVVTSSDSSVYYGANVTFTATVTASSGTPTGTVDFYSDGSSIGSGTLSSGSASVSSSSLAIGTHSITADYVGSSSYFASTSNPISQTITMVPTGISFTTSPNPSLVTNPVNIQIQVTASNGGTPTGAVSVVADGSNNLGSPGLSGGAASLSTSSLSAGTHSITVSYGGTSLYDSSSVTQSQTVNKIPTSTSVNISPASANYGQCVTFTATVSATQGTATGSVTFTANSTSLGTATLNGSAQASVQSCTLQAGTYTVTAAYGGATNFATSSGSASGFTVNKITPGLTWNTPAPITYGTALSGTQLNASAGGVAGTYTYSPVAGTVLSAGSHTLTCNFVPTDTTDYNTPAPVSVILVVNKANPTLTWATPSPITYGTALSGSQLNASATGVTGAALPGGYVYAPSSGTVLTAGTQTLSVTFTPSDTTDYNNASASVTLAVNKANPTVTWGTPTAITYGTALSATQLNASITGVTGATLAGTTVYNPTSGTTLNAGSHTLSLTFTPSDTTDYNNASASVTLIVNKANPTITWATPSPITYGTALSGTQLNATFTGVTGATLPGTPVYTPGAGTVLNGGSQTLSVSFTPTDTTDYNTASTSVTLVVNKANPTLAWATPSPVTYGTALSATQLNATATGVTGAVLPGSFVYNPASGTILTGGSHGLSVTFTPTDTTDYNTASTSVTLVVNKANPTLAWANPSPITYGTPLSTTQLNATATGVTGAALAGTFIYNPAGGAVLTAGTQTLAVTFTPTDTTDYNTAAASVQLTVNQANPVLTWNTPAPIIFGTPLSSTQLNATAAGVGGATLPGSFVYTPSSGMILAVGSPSLSVKFTPTDITDYTVATDSVTIVVNKATPVVSVAVSPEPSYPGDYATVTATVAPVANQYPTGTVTFTIDGATAGTATLANGAGSISFSFLTVGSHSITAAYSGDGTYNSASGTSTHNVILIPTSSVVSATPNPAIGGQQAITIQTITTFPDLMPGTPNNRKPLSGTVQFFDGGVLLGSVSINGTTELAQFTVPSMTTGTHTLTAVYSGDANYTASTTAAFAETLVAPLSAVVVNGNTDATTGANVTYSAMVLNPLKVPQQTGAVTWTANGKALGTSNVGADGSASYSASFPTPGVYSVVASYSGNNQPGSVTVTQTVLSTGTNGSAPFTMSGDTNATMGQDGSTQVSLTLNSAGDTTPVTLTCSGAPAGYTCNLSPSTVTLTAGGTAPTVTVSVTYSQPTTQAQNKKGSEIAFAGLGLGLLALIGIRKRGKALGLLVLMIVALTAGVGLSGCGATKTYASYAPQSYQLTITAAVNSYKESFIVNVGR